MNSDLVARMQKEWDKRGYYQVGSQKYYSKAQAIYASQHTGQWPDFIFNDDAFGRVNWAQEPSETLQEIYRRRAWQLRNKYDYLVLCYSSGSDSTNILHTFLGNNIPIDEIFCYGPFSANQGDKNGTPTRDSVNLYREIDLVALPYLKELSKKHKFKVTVYDWTQDMIDNFKSSDWVWTETQSRLAPSIIVRNRLQNARDNLNIIDQGKNVGFIFGIDKPRIIYKNGAYWTTFLDLIMNMANGPGGIATGSEWQQDEFFYWTPDLPEIIVKQAHVIKNYIEAHPEQKCLVADADQGAWSSAYADQYFDLVKRLIYPGFNPNIWQAKRLSSLTYTEHDSWFTNWEGLDAREHWLAGIRELQNTLDNKWFIKGNVDNGYVGSWSKYYKIG